MLAIGNYRYTTGENFVKRAYKCKEPKMTDIHGRTWDMIGKLQGDIDVYADTTQRISYVFQHFLPRADRQFPIWHEKNQGRNYDCVYPVI